MTPARSRGAPLDAYKEITKDGKTMSQGTEQMGKRGRKLRKGDVAMGTENSGMGTRFAKMRTTDGEISRG